MERTEVCTSCGIRMKEPGDTSFPCPVCGKEVIGRCCKCRDQSVRFKCMTCGFEGPQAKVHIWISNIFKGDIFWEKQV